MNKYLFSVAALLGSLSMMAQTPEQPKEETNVFTVVKSNQITPIKDQASSGTCWSYSATSFLESELIRMGKGIYDLSEMFFVGQSYLDKGEKYVRLHGTMNYAQGGSFYDVLYVLQHYGAVPQEVYTGLNYGTNRNQFGEVDAGSRAFLNAIIKNPNGKLSTAWKEAHKGIIEAYLGEMPEKFTYNGKSYTPKTFAQSLGLKAEDYISITSFTHHPFYKKCVLEIEDNWRGAESYNVPIAEMMEIMENAVDKGFSIAWGTDVSESGFTRNGTAILTDVATIETKGSDQARWLGLSNSGKQAELARMLKSPNCPEIDPTQEYRQQCYDNWTLTDDHGMEIFGLAKNQAGKKFFMVKNSWGETGEYKGIWYASWNFVAGRTMNIVVHKDAIPAAIAKKLGLK